jgi:hypothetical protein
MADAAADLLMEVPKLGGSSSRYLAGDRVQSYDGLSRWPARVRGGPHRAARTRRANGDRASIEKL